MTRTQETTATPRVPAFGRLPVSAIVLAQDEATNIAACLRSLSWADEVVLVDSGSTDGTPELARLARPDVKVLYQPFTNFGEQRNWALDHAEPGNEWVLFLDADERSTPLFATAVAEAIASPGDRAGYFLCYRNIFLDRWIRRSTLYPSWQLRLLRYGRVRFVKEGHGQREVATGRLDYIYEPYDHYTCSKGLSEWITRHNRYSTHEVQLIRRLRAEPLRLRGLLSGDAITRRRCLKRLAARMPLRPLARFLYLYVLRRGFLDGRAGLIYCGLRLAHELHIVAKLGETARANEPTRST